MLVLGGPSICLVDFWSSLQEIVKLSTELATKSGSIKQTGQVSDAGLLKGVSWNAYEWLSASRKNHLPDIGGANASTKAPALDLGSSGSRPAPARSVCPRQFAGRGTKLVRARLENGQSAHQSFSRGMKPTSWLI